MPFPLKKTLIETITKQELENYPEGTLLSVAPAEGYGDHSCQACAISSKCPIVREGVTGDMAFDEPNQCSYYWPPSSPRSPGTKFLECMEQVVREFQEYKARNN